MVCPDVLGHSFQPSFFSKTGSIFPGFFGGFLERFGTLKRIELEATPRDVSETYNAGPPTALCI